MVFHCPQSLLERGSQLGLLSRILESLIKIGYPIGCPKKTLLLSIILAVESLVRMGIRSHQKKFQNYRPINDP